MIVAELMTASPVTVLPNDKLDLAYEKMKAGKFRQVPVVVEGKLIGILTDRDLRQHAEQLSRMRVDAAMTARPLSVGPGTTVERAAHLLATNKIGSLPVLDNGKLVGIITASDMLHALEAILGNAADGSVRIDLDVTGSGEITAAIALIRTVCPVLYMGTYNRRPEGQVLYLRVTQSGVEHAVSLLGRYGFRVLTVHHESDLRATS